MLTQWIIAAMRSAGWEQVEGDEGSPYVRFKRPGTKRIVTVPTDPSDPEFQKFMADAFMEFMAGLRVEPKKDEPKPEQPPALQDADDTHQIGDWVLVWGRVGKGQVHRDDLIVEFRNHSEDWRGLVGRDRVVIPTQNPPFADRCSALFHQSDWPDTYTRCTKHDGHSGLHHTPAGSFSDGQIVGHFDDV